MSRNSLWGPHNRSLAQPVPYGHEEQAGDEGLSLHRSSERGGSRFQSPASDAAHGSAEERAASPASSDSSSGTAGEPLTFTRSVARRPTVRFCLGDDKSSQSDSDAEGPLAQRPDASKDPYEYSDGEWSDKPVQQQTGSLQQADIIVISDGDTDSEGPGSEAAAGSRYDFSERSYLHMASFSQV